MIAPKEHWHVLGAGAIGCLTASHLQHAGVSVTLLTRPGQMPEHLKAGLHLHHRQSTRQLQIPAIDTDSAEEISALLITTKAMQVADAFLSVRTQLQRDAPVVLMHNGMGVLEDLQATFPDIRFSCATTTEGAYINDQAHLIYSGEGGYRFGCEGQADAPAWFHSLQAALPDCHWDDNIQASLWRKLVINAAINPLTVLYQCRNGELLENETYRRHAQLLCEEIARLCQAAGHGQLADQVWHIVSKVMQGTAKNQSSMLQDIRAGRPSEVDFITGYLCRFAHQRNLDCPLNETLLKEIRAMDNSQ